MANMAPAVQLETCWNELQRLGLAPLVVSLDQFGCLCSTMFRMSPNHLLWVLDSLVDDDVVNTIVVP